MESCLKRDNPSLTHENISETRLRYANLISRHDNVNVLNQAYSQGNPESAVCVQLSFDSRNSAIHNAYRILRRPSSLFEPRHPSLKVVRNFFTIDSDQDWKRIRLDITKLSCKSLKLMYRVIDPSAGSPTETLLRLLLPLSNKVHLTSSTN